MRSKFFKNLFYDISYVLEILRCIPMLKKEMILYEI